MASNYHITETDGYGVSEGYTFDKPVGHLNITVEAGVVFTISFDNGTTFLTVPVGFNSIPVGPVNSITVVSDGAFSLVGVQT